MKLIALFGLAAGAILALGQMTAAQWHAAGVALLALTLAHGLRVAPWLFVAFFALLWQRQRGMTQAFRDGYLDKVINPGRRKRRRR